MSSTNTQQEVEELLKKMEQDPVYAKKLLDELKDALQSHQTSDEKSS